MASRDETYVTMTKYICRICLEELRQPPFPCKCWLWCEWCRRFYANESFNIDVEGMLSCPECISRKRRAHASKPSNQIDWSKYESSFNIYVPADK